MSADRLHPPRGARPALLLTVLTACLLLAVPSLARAATITYSGGGDGAVEYAAEAGEALNLTVGFVAGCGVDGGGNPLDCVTFYGNAVNWTPGENCAAQGDGSVWCLLDGDRSGVRVRGGGGADSVSVLEADLSGFPAGAGYAIAVDGGAGDDHLDGGSGAETIHGGPGADAIAGRGGGDLLDGDDGNDTLSGDGTTNGNEGLGGGDDQLHGGAGDDVLTGDAVNGGAVVGHDLLDGGPGTDTVKDDWYRFDGSGNDADPPPAVSFDGLADDGRPGENDNVVGVERIESGSPAGPVPATFVGGEGPDTFMLLFTNGVVEGRGGNDTIAGSDYVDRIDGGAGDDQLSGGFGDDLIVGGPGHDAIDADRTASCEYGPIYGTCTIGAGNDTIYAQDGEVDRIDCGPGADTAYVDAIDSAANCESVQVAAAPAPVPTPAPAPGGGRHPAKGAPAAKLAIPHQGLAAIVRHRAFAFTCKLPRAGRCDARLTVAAGVARALGLAPKRGAKSFTLGTGSATLTKAGTRTVRIRLNRKIVKALRHAHSLRVTLTVTARYRNGARTTTTRRLKLRGR
jgi:Ca2+-binding RTX toxin-like protein